jgi:hypothetical protein
LAGCEHRKSDYEEEKRMMDWIAWLMDFVDNAKVSREAEADGEGDGEDTWASGMICKLPHGACPRMKPNPQRAASNNAESEHLIEKQDARRKTQDARRKEHDRPSTNGRLRSILIEHHHPIYPSHKNGNGDGDGDDLGCSTLSAVAICMRHAGTWNVERGGELSIGV